jgi:hypothetical protein
LTNSMAEPNKPSSQKDSQRPPDALKVDPAIFALKELLYCDKKLKEWVNEIPNSYKLRTESLRNNPELKNSSLFNEDYRPIAEAALLVQKGNPKQAERALESIPNEKLKQQLDYWMVLAYAKHQVGDLIGARNSVRQIFSLPDLEIGLWLLAWSMLRELGDQPEAQIANEVRGVIVEMGVEGTVVVVAGFADGMSRLWFVSGGGGPIGSADGFPKETLIAAKNMVSAAQPLVSTFPLEKDRQLPKQGRIRFALLTAGGIHVKEEGVDKPDNEISPALDSLNSAAQQLLTVLLKYRSEQRKKQ